MRLVRDGEHYGVVGEKTNYRTIHGEDVHVGDIVKVGILGGAFTVTEPMVKSDDGLGNIKAFVMGVEITCDDAEGTVEGRKILEIVKPYTALEVGEKLGECDVEVVEGTVEEKTEAPAEIEDNSEAEAKEMFIEILDKAIEDLRDAGKDYQGLVAIRVIAELAGIGGLK